MKVLRETSALGLIVLFLTVGLSYGQDIAEESYDKGVRYAIQGKFKEAKEEFERALKIDQFFIPAKESLKIIEAVIDQKIKSKTAIHFFKGETYYNKGQWGEAISEYNKAIEINPRFAEAYNNRGISFAQGKGQYDQAISDFDKAIEINSKFAEAYNNRGISYFNKGQYDQAISDYDKAIEINPRHAEAYYKRGLVYAQVKGQYDQAISDFDKAIEINPRFAEAYNNRGLVYMVKLGNKKKACSDWKRACELGNCRNYTIAKRKGDCE